MILLIIIIAFQVTERPVTQQGLGGLKMGTQGPGRMVQDKTYFQSELRQRVGLVTNEIHRLTTEAETLEKEGANFTLFEKR